MPNDPYPDLDGDLSLLPMRPWTERENLVRGKQSWLIECPNLVIEIHITDPYGGSLPSTDAWQKTLEQTTAITEQAHPSALKRRIFVNYIIYFPSQSTVSGSIPLHGSVARVAMCSVGFRIGWLVDRV